jgi:hypothetical protein
VDIYIVVISAYTLVPFRCLIITRNSPMDSIARYLASFFHGSILYGVLEVNFFLVHKVIRLFI